MKVCCVCSREVRLIPGYSYVYEHVHDRAHVCGGGRIVAVPIKDAASKKPITYMAEILAWRGFRLSDDWQLHSPVMWNGQPFSLFEKNTLTDRERLFLTEASGNGYYSFKSRNACAKYFRIRPSFYSPPRHGRFLPGFGEKETMVFATVRLLDTVVEHELGYRSQSFEIVGLYSAANSSYRRTLAHKLGWPGKVLHLSKGRDYKPEMIEIPSQEA